MQNSETETPLVSVWMITYNHEKYIAQAIEGVLMQKIQALSNPALISLIWV
jgi:glycosyltransferase involved in cell wall biosynthesis